MDFGYKNSLSSREVKIVGWEDPNCAMFIHLGGGLYETMQSGTITCEDKKIRTFSKSVGDTFASKLNQKCNSSCVTTNTGSIKTVRVKIDPLPAPHATLVRGLDGDIGTVMDGRGGGDGNEQDKLRIEALLDKNIRETKNLLTSYQGQGEEIFTQNSQIGIIIGLGFITIIAIEIIIAGGVWYYKRKCNTAAGLTRYRAVGLTAANNSGTGWQNK